MTALNLEDIEADFLDAPCVAVLGDTILYRALGRAAYSTIKGFVEHSDLLRDLASGQVIEQDVTVEVFRADVPVRPAAGVRIQFPRITGVIFKAVNTRLNPAGSGWIFEVARV